MRCSACKRDHLDPSEFAIDRRKPTGLKPTCKACDNERSKRYYREHGAERKAAQYAASHSGPRLCAKCDRPTVSSRHPHCPSCQIIAEDKRAKRKRPIPMDQRLRERQRARARPTAEERGYDSAHRKERRRHAPAVATGTVSCARCGHLIPSGAPWDLGHVDGSNKTQYAGPEHRACNRATAGRNVGGPRPRQKRKTNSRRWL